MADKNDAYKRIYEDENFQPVFPDDNIICKDCIFSKSGSAGYKNGYCEVYAQDITNGKPNDILFKNAKCKYYKKD